MDRAQVRHVAELAELSLTEEEEARLAEEMGRILAYVAELEAIDTADVPPTAHVGDAALRADALRPDEVRPGISHEDALGGAPEVEHGGFAVPSFLE
jgi:aspartyl-tRNA(Asn)/glutamyl-tRNA(Gln) amidotransferase subunit C